MGIFIWLKNKIKGHDLYAKPITMFYKGDQKLKSAYGGFISVLIKILILIFACLLTRVIFNRSATKKIANQIVYDLISDTTKHYLGKNNFQVAIGFYEFRGRKPTVSLLDKTYFSLNVFALHTKRYNDTHTSHTESLEYDYWDQNDFPEVSGTKFSRLDLSSYLWIK